MIPLALAGAGLGLAGGIANMIGNSRANRKLEQLLQNNPKYAANPLAAQQLGLAQTLLNARMPGAAAAERNIFQNQANMMGQVNRNATDASQALALAAAGQGQTNQALGNLSMQEAQDYQRRYGNLVNAQATNIQEGDKVFQDKIRRFQDEAQIRGAQNANRQNTWSSLSNLGFGVMNLGMAGGFDGMFGGGGGRGANKAPGAYGYDPKFNYENTLLPRSFNMPLASY
jgi:hypothetical protein